MERQSKRRSRGKPAASLGPTEKRLLCQLGACLVLFLTVFLFRGADRLSGLRQELSRTLRSSPDFQSSLNDLDWSLRHARPADRVLDRLWRELFLGREKASPIPLRHGMIYLSARKALVTHTLPLLPIPQQDEIPADPFVSTAAKVLAAPAEEAVPAIVHMDYFGPALPENTTMDLYHLSLCETVVPVWGRLSSGFGWREHPIEGGSKFHQGVDIAVDTGTPVLAFADGVVDYIGESDIYGQYLQLRHEDGVTSFYAHCSKLLVAQGNPVEAGQTVALSGATGHVTGPHLHFELKKDGVRLNPVYYLSFLP